jgi:hypothetical protein
MTLTYERKPMSRLAVVLKELHKQRQNKQAELKNIDDAIVAINRIGRQLAGRTGKRRLSAAARARIAAAQKARWAKRRTRQRKKAA